MKTMILRTLLFLSVLTACGDDDPMLVDGGGDAGPLEGVPVEAADFCARMAALVCEVNERCCDGVVAGRDLGDPDAGVDAGVGDGGMPDAGRRDAGPAPSCEMQQLDACEDTVQALVDDPRTAYVPARGGAYLAALEAQARGCFTEAPEVTDFMSVFEGTGIEGADCTPRTTSEENLRLSQLSCADGLTCHLRRRSDGTTLGVCEPRVDQDCSHALDCDPGLWCNLPDSWEPGRWGTCQPLRANGWDCESDQECASRYCSSAGTCGDPDPERYCAASTYAGTVVVDRPVGYWRLGDAPSSTAVAVVGADGEYLGESGSAPGAIRGDEDEALSLASGEDGVRLPEDVGEAIEGPMSLELWFRRTEESPAGPLLEFGVGEEMDRGARIWNYDAPDKVHLNLRDTGGDGHATTSAEGTVAAERWVHVVGTYDGSVGRLYVNGDLVGEEIPGAFSPQTSGPLFVGIRMEDEEERHILGAVDEVAVYDHALSARQIAAHTARGREGPAEQEFVLFRWLR